MKKLEQYYNELLKRRKKIQSIFFNLTQKHKDLIISNLMNCNNDDINYYKLLIDLQQARYSEINIIIEEFKEIYKEEVKVIDGYCREFKVK